MNKLPVLREQDLIQEIFNDLGTLFPIFIAGGFARYCVTPTPELVFTGDIDLATEGPNAFNFFKDLLDSKFGAGTENDYTVTYKNGWNALKVQLIKPTVVFGWTLEDIIKQIDFTVCRVGLIDKDTALADPDFLKDEERKKIVFAHPNNPVNGVRRIAKYLNKGYTIDNDQILSLLEAYKNAPEQKRNTLISTLTRTKGASDYALMNRW